MTEAADVPLRKYSKGMTQRLGIAQAFVNRPRLVFLDEPMSGLDPLGRREMSHLIRELRDSGVTVFFCSHILSDVEQLCDRVAILNRGKLVQAGRLSEIIDVSLRAVEVVVEGLSSGAREPDRGVVPRDLRRQGSRSHLSFPDMPSFEKARAHPSRRRSAPGLGESGERDAGGSFLPRGRGVGSANERRRGNAGPSRRESRGRREPGLFRKIGYVALNTYRETVRDKVLYNLVLFALLMIGSSYVLGAISVYQEIKIIKDLGLAAISVFGMVIAIFIGIGLVSKEMEKRTLYSVLPKPISRVSVPAREVFRSLF